MAFCLLVNYAKGFNDALVDNPSTTPCIPVISTNLNLTPLSNLVCYSAIN